MKNSLIKQCLDILKTEDVRNEIKVLFSPVTDLILYEIYPYPAKAASGISMMEGIFP